MNVPPGEYEFTYDVMTGPDVVEQFTVTLTLVDPCINPTIF